MSLGGIEAGGTRWNCAVGGGGKELERVESFATTTPRETIARAVALRGRARPRGARGRCIRAGRRAAQFAALGTITTTPKPGWTNTDVAASLGGALGVPIAVDTYVNAAAVGEWRWGAANGLDTFCYLTVGTGIGGGVFANGRPVHGLLHPEVGHVRIPHDLDRDPFPGSCPFHGDCLEGLASGTALRKRWGRPGEELTDPGVWELEAQYLALGLMNVVLVLSAQRIVLGGGVGGAPGLIERVRVGLRDLLAGYVDVLQFGPGIDDYLVPPALGARSGVVGAIELAVALKHRTPGPPDTLAR